MPNTRIKMVLKEKGRDVLTIHPDASVFAALKEMAKLDVGALLVMEQDTLVGVISERDYARKVALEGKTSADTIVADIMTKDVVCTAAQQTVAEAMAIMTERAVRHLPVLEDNKVVGVVSIGDLVKTIIREQEFVIDQLEHYIQSH